LFHNHAQGCQLAFLNAKYVKSDNLKSCGKGNFGLELFPYLDSSNLDLALTIKMALQARFTILSAYRNNLAFSKATGQKNVLCLATCMKISWKPSIQQSFNFYKYNNFIIKHILYKNCYFHAVCDLRSF